VTQSELDLHQKNLRDMSTLALDTTRSVIEGQVGEISNMLTAPSSAINQALTSSGQRLTEQASRITTTLDASAETLSQTLGGAQKSLSEASGRVKVSANKTATAIVEQQKAMRLEIVKQQKLLFWMMKLPMLGVLAFCLLVCAGTWGWSQYQIGQMEQREVRSAQYLGQLQQQQATVQQSINALTTQFCASAAGRGKCTYPKN